MDIRETREIILSMANRLWQVHANSEHAGTGGPPAGWTDAEWQLSHATSDEEDIYEWFEFHKSPEFAKAFRERFDALRKLAGEADRSKRTTARFRLQVRLETGYLRRLAGRLSVPRRKPEGRKKHKRRRSPGFTPKQKALIDYLKENRTPVETAKHFDVVPSAISRMCKRIRERAEEFEKETGRSIDLGKACSLRGDYGSTGKSGGRTGRQRMRS